MNNDGTPVYDVLSYCIWLAQKEMLEYEYSMVCYSTRVFICVYAYSVLIVACRSGQWWNEIDLKHSMLRIR